MFSSFKSPPQTPSSPAASSHSRSSKEEVEQLITALRELHHDDDASTEPPVETQTHTHADVSQLQGMLNGTTPATIGELMATLNRLNSELQMLSTMMADPDLHQKLNRQK